MRRIEVRPFGEADLPAAGRLLAARHRRHRVAQPLLSARYEDPAVAEKEVAEAWAEEHASGAVAVRDGEVVGYLLGAPKKADPWGPNIWVESAGQAVTGAEAMRDMYALAAERWVAEGRTAHYTLVPAHDTALVAAWFRLGFGHQHTHGIRELPQSPPVVPDGLVVRRVTRADIPVLAQLEIELPAHQVRSPVFSASPPPTLKEGIEEWEADFDDPEFTTFVAEYDGKVVGSAVGCALEKSGAHAGPARPDHAGFLGFAAVLPEARGRGAGRALGETVLAWSAERGYDCVVTDWRTTNLLSSRTWPALGFRDSFARLHRLIGY
jgi:ribosomal protein S18 acetylase RimI-like enzyme